MLERYFVTPMVKKTLSRNAYGDYVISGNDVTYYGRFRLLSENARMSTRVGSLEQATYIEAEGWLPPTADIADYDILYINGEYWEVSRIREAKRGRHNDVSFLKFNLNKHTLVS